MKKNKIAIIGAGPGGLTAGMILAKRGYQVEIFEKEAKVGGRNSSFDFNGYSFDIGPTFLMMKFILEEVFEMAGRQADSYLQFIKLDPMYRLHFKDLAYDIVSDPDKMKDIIEKNFPGNKKGFDKFQKRESLRYKRMYPCLQKSYSNFRTFFHPDFIKALPHLGLTGSMMDALSNYFTEEELKISFTFQSKYLGMSPWNCPAGFTMIPFVEHEYGIYHVIGGLNKISFAMEKVFKEHGGKIHFNSPIKNVIVDSKSAKGIELENGDKVFADKVIINSDFGYSMSHLVGDDNLSKWNTQKLLKKNWSCSTYMLYLGVDKEYDSKFHNIYFSKDYKKYINGVSNHEHIKNDFSFYIRNASVLDKTVAPKGHSNIYILVPVSNKLDKFNWQDNKKEIRDTLINEIKSRSEFTDIDKHIVTEKIVTPDDWENQFNVFLGATFNLGHNVSQMLYWRPHNKFEEINNLYLVGGGTHPGSGLPTIYESARITANLLDKS